MATGKHMDKSSDDMVLKPDLNITFGNKASLRRSEETGIPLEDEMVIAILEGDAAGGEYNEDLARIYANTKLHSDPAITYPDHDALKKKVITIPITARIVAAAAIILLLISIGAWITFSPASSPVRQHIVLATLETRPVKMEAISSGGLELRSTNNDITMIAARKEFELSGIELKNASQVQVQLASSISGQMSGISPSNTQQPTPNTYDYALADPKQRTFIGKVFNGMFSRVKAPFERSEAQAKPGPEKGFSIWDIAELGLKGVNTLGDHDYTLVRDYNENGNVKRVILLDE